MVLCKNKNGKWVTSYLAFIEYFIGDKDSWKHEGHMEGTWRHMEGTWKHMETQASMWKGVAYTLQAILLGQVSAKVESHDQSINKSLSSSHMIRHM